jgi:hypothetical protein
MDLPVVPVEREAVDGDDVELIQRALPIEPLDEQGVDGRDAAGEPAHVAEGLPFLIELQVPVGLVVRLVPDHRSFDHRPSVAQLRAQAGVEGCSADCDRRRIAVR